MFKFPGIPAGVKSRKGSSGDEFAATTVQELPEIEKNERKHLEIRGFEMFQNSMFSFPALGTLGSFHDIYDHECKILFFGGFFCFCADSVPSDPPRLLCLTPPDVKLHRPGFCRLG